MDFLLFVFVNAALFIRPAEVIPGVQDLQVYTYAILPCLIIATPGILDQLRGAQRVARPVTVCVLGLWVAVVLSHLFHGEIEKAGLGAFEFGKVVAYYLIFVAIVNTPRRLRAILFWITTFGAVMTLVAVLEFHGVLQTAAPMTLKDVQHDQLGEDEHFVRLTGSGIFNDPNDFCLLLVIVIPLTLYRLLDGSSRSSARVIWLIPLGLFFYALALTQSRGGFIAVMVGVLVLVHARYGRVVTLALVATIIPAALVMFSGRQTDVSMSEGTGQQRLQLWDDGLMYLRESPLFGIGADEFMKRSSLVAHNSFVHSFAEMGLFGGTLFLGAFLYSLWALYRFRRARILDPTARGLQPYLLAVIASLTALMMSLSRGYLVPTYMVLAMVTSYLRFATALPPVPVPRVSLQLAQRFALASFCFLAMTYVLVRTLVRWS
jgi:O-antigen ligase